METVCLQKRRQSTWSSADFRHSFSSFHLIAVTLIKLVFHTAILTAGTTMHRQLIAKLILSNVDFSFSFFFFLGGAACVQHQRLQLTIVLSLQILPEANHPQQFTVFHFEQSPQQFWIWTTWFLKEGIAHIHPLDLSSRRALWHCGGLLQPTGFCLRVMQTEIIWPHQRGFPYHQPLSRVPLKCYSVL